MNDNGEIFTPTTPTQKHHLWTKITGQKCFSNKFILNIINESDKMHIYPPSFHRDLYQKLVQCPTSSNEEDINLVIEELVDNKDFQKSDTEIETYESKEDLKHPQEYDDGGIFILDHRNKREMNDPRLQEMFKRSRHIKPPIFIISQVYYELPERMIRTNRNIHHIFIDQDKGSKVMSLSEFKYLTNSCWDKTNLK